MAMSYREFGFETPAAMTGDRGRPSLLVVTAPPPPALQPTTRIILHGVILEGAAVIRAVRDPGPPVPVLPPIPARDARRLRDLLATRGVRAEVHALGHFRRARAVFGSGPADVEEALARAISFAARAGVAEAERAQLAAG
ncbi:MAG TPA: hypothetical protein VHF22_04625, partial [Planctomycetota bacterium]|nr:hypothetical protein [Planctomycetota bacterium]